MPDVTDITSFKFVNQTVRSSAANLLPMIQHSRAFIESWKAFDIAAKLGVDQEVLDTPANQPPPDPAIWPEDKIVGPSEGFVPANPVTVREACRMYRACLFILRVAEAEGLALLLRRLSDNTI